MINEVSPSVEQEEMNTRGEKDEYTTFKCFSKFRNIRNYIGKFVSNQCLIVKNWKFNPIIKSKDRGAFMNFRKNQERRKS